ncbi:MAG: GNAT family N-acetyltransferase [Bacteroidales bacterium]|nr:GNAT family N-acetyltransferase [Bacteroidales bacterium]MCF8337155.1 GNAT family N-acetyltransferase [Bacteroidales bacterium]
MPKITTRYLEETEFNLWDSFVETQKYGNIYQHTTWLNTIFKQQNGNIKIKIIACFDKEDRIIGGIAFGLQKKFGVKLIVHPFLSQFSGILIPDRNTQYASKNLKYRKEILESIIEKLEEDLDVIDLNLPPEINDIRPFTWNRFSTDVKYTFIQKLDHPEEILNNFEPAIRRQIKKAQKEDISINTGAGHKLVNDFYQLLTMSYKRQKHQFKFTLEEFFSIIESVKKIKSIHVSFYLAYLSEKPVAGQAILFFNNTAYYWLAGGNPEYFNTGVNQYIMYKIIEDSFSNGMKWFDFIGANTPGVENYKATYNFPLVPYYKVKKTLGLYPNLMMFLKNKFL